MTTIRLAAKDDARRILDIYAPYIVNTATSFETGLPSKEDMEIRIANCLQKYPWIVCVIDDTIASYVYASKHREREAYQWSCESSIYVADEFKGKGIGKKLYQLLFQVLKLQGFRNVYAGITLPNEASVKLHGKCGFTHFATYENIGYKLGNWQTVGWWKLQINEYDLNPPPPMNISTLDVQLLENLFQQTAESI